MRMHFERTDGGTIDTTSRARLRARLGARYQVTQTSIPTNNADRDRVQINLNMKF